MKSIAALILIISSVNAFANSVGVVKAVKGDVQLTSENGVAKALVLGDQIHEHDRIATDKTSTLFVELSGGDKLIIFNNSRLSLREYSQAKSGRTAIIDLFKGKIRSKTKFPYDGKTSRYQVITQGISADVEGTADFFLSHDKSTHVVSRAEVLDGKITLRERMGDQVVPLSRGELDTYALNDAVIAKDSEWGNSPEKGFFNPTRKLSIAEFEELYKSDSSEDIKAQPSLKIQKEVKTAPQQPICQKPNGLLNQCAWHCVNNLKDAKDCATSKPGVSCVRLRCNANGVWAEETKLPPADSSKCKAKGDVVDECDY